VLALVDAIRTIAYEPSYHSEPDDQMRRIQDLLGEHYGLHRSRGRAVMIRASILRHRVLRRNVE
jgi:hypothetical protein